ncbi:MAG TPA: bifunctional [glutamate--ammonia ligase]-adenylyl-L-tyrosine phosphorylase/[glutamate--ammonia-ligase] adenylyltransferase [Candidatus Binataceae bacterium]|nr:bifunctional [glutamate--ammonia ligase]-adenylyl-L-tyrosine phosphorylase/[glutamate--ammonia-ligase] adenylyltransferase [Candidatus Binataceae bacterium]
MATVQRPPALSNALARKLEATLGDATLARRAMRLATDHAADEQLALATLSKLAEESPASMRELLREREKSRDLVFCVGASEIVANEISQAGAGWPGEFDAARTGTVESLLGEMRCDLMNVETRGDAARELSFFKRRIFLRIAVADLIGRIDVTRTMLLMSRLADECIRAAFEIAVRLTGELAREAGEFCVLAMGKLGASELNLSSDIDLVYIFDPQAPGAGSIAAARVGEIITELLATGCFRIDMRLRPGGRNSPLAVPLEGALQFYQSYGQTWERAALLRARPVAGSLGLGRRMLDELSRFVYRSYLDFDTLRQLRMMKHQVEAELRSPDLIERNLKLGHGGIRELEFIVQALTLIYGGRDPRIRIEKTIPALERLADLGYLPAPRAHHLADAYLYLRNIEHKLQIVSGLQTHTLPRDDAGLRQLAARMRLGKSATAPARLRSTLRKHRELVAKQFRETLVGGEEESITKISEVARSAWQGVSDRATAERGLAAMGFAHPKESSSSLEILTRGSPLTTSSPRRLELLETLGPLLLDEISRLPDPDLALRNLADFITAVGARTSFLALLEQHPSTRRVLLSLFASSSYLSSLFIRHPDMLDTLVRSDLAQRRRHREDLHRELSGLMKASADFEARLDALRTFRHQEFLRIAIADVAGELDLADVEAELTLLAETVLNEALALAYAEIAARFEIPSGLKLACIAMGRLGAAEMSYNSDLDLIFVYQSGDDAARGREVATRVVQKLIAILESRTREGYAYKLDLRLRPSGNQGPLVTSIEGFRDYHRQSSAVWERQALVRGRVIAGDYALGVTVEAAREEFVFGRGMTASEIAEIAQMRARMEKEIGVESDTRLNLKQGRGGLVDVEFVAQMMALAHGYRHPSLRKRSTRELLRAIEELHLINDLEAASLRDGFEFIGRLENRLRIESDQPAWALPTDGESLRTLARRMRYEGGAGPQRLLADLRARREAIRTAFESCFARERGAAAASITQTPA